MAYKTMRHICLEKLALLLLLVLLLSVLLMLLVLVQGIMHSPSC